MPSILWTPRAVDEFEEIIYHIRIKGGRPITALRIAEQLIALLEKHAIGARKGHRHQDAPDKWLYFKFKRWLLFYQVIEDGIEVMRVIDGSRDLPPQFHTGDD